ncbi:MAG: nucleotidyltransferase domain-containing protein [bacterium]
MQRRSFGSVRIAFLDKNRAVAELIQCAQRLMVEDHRVLCVGLFGSLARGEAVPSSDADLLIVLKEHSMGLWFERISEYADAFGSCSLPVEVFAYTVEELRRMLSEHSGFLRGALRELVPLSGDNRIWKELM